MAEKTFIEVLTEHSFVEDNEALESLRSERSNLSERGPYSLLQAWSKGDALVWHEQNVSPEEDGEVSYVVTHPSLLVIRTLDGSVAVRPHETIALEDALTALGV